MSNTQRYRLAGGNVGNTDSEFMLDLRIYFSTTGGVDKRDTYERAVNIIVGFSLSISTAHQTCNQK